MNKNKQGLHGTASTFFSHTWGVEVRADIAREFTAPNGVMDDNLAGLHEIRARIWDDAGHDPQRLFAMIRKHARTAEVSTRHIRKPAAQTRTRVPA